MTCYHCALEGYADRRAQTYRARANRVAATRRSHAAKREELRRDGPLYLHQELRELRDHLELLEAEEQTLREQAAAWQQQADQMSCPRHAGAG